LNDSEWAAVSLPLLLFMNVKDVDVALPATILAFGHVTFLCKW
jgi:hypothetical protein